MWAEAVTLKAYEEEEEDNYLNTNDGSSNIAETSLAQMNLKEANDDEEEFYEDNTRVSYVYIIILVK